MNIAILCPSRGRPARFREMWESAKATASAPEQLRVWLLVDEDDPAYGDYPDTDGALIVDGVSERAPGPVRLERAWYGALRAGAEIVFVGADDIVFESRGWDDALRNAFGGPGPAAVAPNDGSGKAKWTHFAVNRRWLEVVGHLCPDFEHFCVDTYVEQIATLAGRGLWLKDVVVRHRHRKYDKSLNDATYEARRVRGEDGKRPSDRDEARLLALRPQIERLATKVRAACYEPRWRGGTFTTAQLKARMVALLAVLEARAQADREAGRFAAADELDELVEVVQEWTRLMENGARARDIG